MSFESAPAYGEIAGERAARLATIKATINSWPNISDDLKTALRGRSDELLDAHISGRDNRFAGGQIGFRTWIIRNDDLKLLELLIPALTAVVIFVSAPAAPPAVLIASLAFSALGIANKLRNRGIRVDPEDFHILMALKQAGPSTPSRIAEILSGLHIYGKEVWDESRVIAALNKLKLLPQNDGATATVVNESSDGRWSTAGI